MRNTPDQNDDTVSANSRRSQAVAGLFGATPEKSEVNVSNLNQFNNNRSQSNPPSREHEAVT
jgi:hypothetical protein